MKFVRYVSLGNVLDEFGERIRAHRLASNLSQEEVAFQAGIRLSNLARFEAGQESIDFVAFVKICLALGMKDRVPEWVPVLPETDQGRTRYRDRLRRRASKRIDPIPKQYDDPEAYWSHVKWIWEP